ncbi:ArsR/SmtB family transcription factor [Paenibacillus septentrionalis]|uniref:ArsR/SmtB family transcription factor n=1 Tax=Paenibacillus septentrionalis TaxID=429342 RepID=A0ABW1V5D3_9BACL
MSQCEIYCYNEEKVQEVQSSMRLEELEMVAQLFKALSDVNRSKIIYALCQSEELCVCDLANIIGASVATTSHHLRAMNKRGLVKFRKEGKLAFYALDDEHIRSLMTIALEHNKELKQHEQVE